MPKGRPTGNCPVCRKPLLLNNVPVTWVAMRGTRRGPRVNIHVYCARPEAVDELRRLWREGRPLNTPVPGAY